MADFAGFPARMDYTPVPSPFLGAVLEEIDDLAELKCALRIFWHLHRKKGALRSVTLSELLGDRVVTAGLAGDPSASLRTGQVSAEEGLRQLVGRLERRGVLLVVAREGEGESRGMVLLNTPQNRQAVGRLRLGQGGIEPVTEAVPSQPAVERPTIFHLYEENIGLLTPLISEELKDAERTYPETWLHEAFQEAVRGNKRSWRYIARILERWAQEGRDDGEPGRHSEAMGAKEYIRRYGLRRGG